MGHIRLTGTPPDWLAASGSETDAPFPANPDATFAVDTDQERREAEMLARTQAEAVRPDRRLDSAALWQKCRWSRDPQKFALATSQFGFPKPIDQTDARNLFLREPVSHVWSERAVDKWVETISAKAAELAMFLSR